jgi:hypothetical protein
MLIKFEIVNKMILTKTPAIMRYFFVIIFSALIFSSCTKGQLENVLTNPDTLTNDEVVMGLKEALRVGTDTSVNLTNRVDGYLKNAAIKILLPPEAQEVEKYMRAAGFGSMVDDAIVSLNRAAEDAAIEAKPIFKDAITSITIEDGFNILKGDTNAATMYLKGKTFTNLQGAFQPKIKNSLDKTNATKYWNTLFTAYNSNPLITEKVNPDLDVYATQKALDGLFYMVSLEERDIRKDPAARVSDILEKVFGQQ